MDEHNETIALLRGVADDGREASTADIAAAMHVGRKIRRRRRTLQVVGSGGVVGVAVAMLAMTGGGAQPDTVTSAGAPGPVADNGSKPKPSAAKPAPSNRTDNIALLAAGLGSDFRIAVGDDPTQGDVEVIPGSASAQRLGSGYDAGAWIEVFDPATSNGFTIQSACKPSVEKGSHSSACRALKLDDGRIVQVQDERDVVGDWRPGGGRTIPRVADSEFVYFARADGTFVRVYLVAFDASARPAAAQQQVSDAWLTSYIPTLAKIAADPRIKPVAGEVHVTGHDRDQAILQRALGGDFTLYDGTVQLEPGSKKAAELPDGKYGAKAELSSISATAFHAACDAKAGLAPCETKTLDDGTVVHLRSWADRDATDNQMRGESAAYLERKDGSVLLANLEVTGRQVTAAQADEHAKVVRQWLGSLQSALITAITDKNVVGTPGD